MGLEALQRQGEAVSEVKKLDPCPKCGEYHLPEKGCRKGLNLPYPFCMGNPTYADCHNVGYCRRRYACDD